MSPAKRRIAVLLGGPDCGKQIRVRVRALMLKDGSTYEKTDERDRAGRVIYRHSWKGLCS